MSRSATPDDPTVSVGFVIRPVTAGLAESAKMMDSVTAQVTRQAELMEKSTGGMWKHVGGGRMELQSLGNTVEREMAKMVRSNAAVEKSGEAWVRQLNRQIETAGKTTAEVRQLRAEQAALAAEQRGMTELAGRIRTANTQLSGLQTGLGKTGQSAGAYRQAMIGASYQTQDFLTQVSMGANPLNAFAVQGAQLAGQFASVEGKAGAVARFFMGPWGMAITGAVMLTSMFSKELFGNSEASAEAEKAAADFQKRQGDIALYIDTTTGALIEQNRQLVINATLTREAQIAANQKRIAESRDAAFGAARTAMATGFAEGDVYAESRGGGPAMGGVDRDVARAVREANGDVEKLTVSLATLARTTRPDLRGVATEISGIGGQAVLAQRENADLQRQIRALDGDVTAMRTNATAAINRQVELATATTPLARARAELEIVKQTAAAADRQGGEALERYRADLTRTTQAVHAAEEAERAASRARSAGNRETRHIERLERTADATEAQTRNLYALADAYGVSGAAALMADARVKAESAAIRARGSVEADFARQIELSVAQRIADAAKSTASMRDQLTAQAEVNRQVAAGLVPAERAADLVRDRITDLPILAAIEVATLKGTAAQVAALTRELDAQRQVRGDLRRETMTGTATASIASANGRLAEAREELRLVGAIDEVRGRAMTSFRAKAETVGWAPEEAAEYERLQLSIFDTQQAIAAEQWAFNDALRGTVDLFDAIDQSALSAARAMGDGFGKAGESIGGLVTTVTGYYSQEARLRAQRDVAIRDAGKNEVAIARENRIYALNSSALQFDALMSMTGAAKGFFKENSAGYQAMGAAEKVLAGIQLARTAIDVAGGAARMFATMGPLAFPAVAAMGAVMAGLGFAGGGNASGYTPETNAGTGTVLGDRDASSESIRRGLDGLREIDDQTLTFTRQMEGHLRSIDGQIGGVAAVLVRGGGIEGVEGVADGFRTNAIGSVLKAIVPIFGGALAGLFGTKQTVTGGGIYGAGQSVGNIIAGGFDARTYSDVERQSKFLGITTGTRRSTVYGSGVGDEVSGQVSLIFRDLNRALVAAAGPLGANADTIASTVSSFVFTLGKVDLKGLSGEQVQERLNAVFGAAADRLATTAFPGLERFQRVGEGVFETVVRISSTVESVTSSLDQLGSQARALGLDAKVGLADLFGGAGEMSSAVDAYFNAFYTREEQAAARRVQLERAFTGLGVGLPDTLAGFRALVDAQNLATEAGRSTYATLLQLAPAFSELQAAMSGAKSAADILAERSDLERRILELNGDTAALRALDLEKVDASNRLLQRQVWAVEDAQAAARAADELGKAWSSVGDSLMDEVRRIRGLTDAAPGAGFASLMGDFNRQTILARQGDQEAAKALPGLSQSLLRVAGETATSRQELSRVQAQTAASLETTFAAIARFSGSGAATPADSANRLLAAMETAPGPAGGSGGPQAANDDLKAEIRELRAAIGKMHDDNNRGHAATSASAASTARILDRVTGLYQGQAIAVGNAG